MFYKMFSFFNTPFDMYFNAFFYSYSMFKIFYYLNFYFSLFFIFFVAMLFYANQSFLSSFFNKNFFLKKIIKLSLVSNLIVSFFVFLITVYLYLHYTYHFHNNLILNNIFFVPNISSLFNLNLFFNNNWLKLSFCVDFFGLALLFLSYLVGFVALLVLDSSMYFKNMKFLFSFNLFVLMVYFFVSTQNLLLFFFFYEALLMPSFFFVFFMSPSKSAVQASIYFVIWTQIGSVLVLLVFCYFCIFLNVWDFFSLKNMMFSYNEAFFIYLLIFLGFGFKVPVWPFHYWLTKTHVEAPSGFSIYLSGFLVKSALFGFYKMMSSMNVNMDVTIFAIFCFFSVFDSSLKMWGQTDLKKMAAYGTMQEMNLMYIMLILGDVFSIYAVVLFVLTHAFLSALMFFIVDCIYKSFHTRSMVVMNGILSMCPNLGIMVMGMLLCFAGLPGTMKFTVEFFLFGGLIDYSMFFSLLLMMVANMLGLMGFSKPWFNSMFGLKLKKVSLSVLDLSYKEILIYLLIFFFLFFFSFFLNYFVI